MLKDLFKTILLLSAVIIGGNIIALCQKITTSMPGYMMLLTIICMLVVAWSQVIKLVKGELIMTTNEFYNELSNMNLSSENLINIICDYFDSNVFEGLLEHIKNEY